MKSVWIFFLAYSNDMSERKEFEYDIRVSHRVAYGSLVEYLLTIDEIPITINLLNAPKK